ncbi:MAG: choice-of-anchor I family protein [Planctomycetes bacterium]|nr:choice-of-anchor I family protein [Planctomycetota bacterium]
MRALLAVLLLSACVLSVQAADPVVRNWGLGAVRGLEVTLTRQALLALDPDTPPDQLIYTITAAPSKGTLRKEGSAIGVNATFTQADIDAGRITYQHAAGEQDAMDAVTLSLTDGASTQSGQVLRIMVAPAAPLPLRVQKIGEYRVPSGYNANGGVAEIVAYSPQARRLFLVNGVTGTVDVLAFATAQEVETPSKIATLDPKDKEPAASDVTSVACHGNLVALAVANSVRTQPGFVFFYRADTGAYVSHLAFATAIDQSGGVRGALPDMVTFTPDGSKVLLAIEGEPANDYSVDPEGGVIVVAVVNGVPASSATWIGFPDDKTAEYRQAGVRIHNDKATPAPAPSAAKDMEPEYIAVSPDSSRAFVSCQENNALAIIDLNSLSLLQVVPLGTKDHSLPANSLDLSDEDGGTDTNSGTPTIKFVTGALRGMYMPDGLAAFTHGGQTYIVSANEGDGREYAALNDEPRLRDAVSSNLLEPSWASDPRRFDSNWGRLRISRFDGDTDGNGRIDVPHAFGARSFSVWAANGTLVWDSGDQFERFFATYLPTFFNVSNSNNTFDNRSPAKGPEPEGVVVGEIAGRRYAFIGLERSGGVMMYDITAPEAPVFTTYFTGRLFHQTPGSDSGGDLAPEGLLFIAAEHSPTGRPLLVVGNEVSGTVAIHEIVPHPFPKTNIAADRPTLNPPSGTAVHWGRTTSLALSAVGASDPQNDSLQIAGGNAAGSRLRGEATTAAYVPTRPDPGSETVRATVADRSAWSVPVPRGLYASTAGGVHTYLSGFGSGIAPVPGRSDEFWLLADRGPNVDGNPSSNKIFPVPDYQIGMARVRLLADGTLQVLEHLRFRHADGSPMRGLPAAPGAAGTTNETGYALDPVTNTPASSPLDFDPDGLDPEAIVALPDGSFWLSDEYGPWLVRLSASGQVIERIGPFGTAGSAKSPNPHSRKLPSVYAKRRANRGMEGLTLTPSGWLIGMMQSPLLNPSSQAVGGTGAGSTRICRILCINPANWQMREYAYVLESHNTAVSAILALNDQEFLVLERDGGWPGAGSTLKKVFRIHLGQATDIHDPADSATGKLIDGKTIEELKTAEALLAAGISPVAKWEVVDILALTDQHGTPYPHDKPEGLALIDDNRTLIIVNDDDFGIVGNGAGGIQAKTVPGLGNRVDFNSLWFVGLDEKPLTVEVQLPPGYSHLQILHASDGEAGIAAVEDLPRFSAVLQALRNQYPTRTLTLSSGDNWIPGPFYNAAGDPAANAISAIGAASVGRGDIAVMNALGFQASCFGNHEFDAGTREVRNILLNSGAWTGAQFPYLACNLDFSNNDDLKGMVVADGQALNSSLARKISGSVVATVDGVQYGIIGATTPLLPRISSPGTVVTHPANPTDYAALAGIIQQRVNALRDAGVRRIILLAHMQQWQIEANELAPRLDGVDLIIAGGSHAIFADGNDRLRPGHSKAADYPLWRTSASNEPVAVLQAGANWQYVGRFVGIFDDQGRLVRDSVVPQLNGVYATDAQGVSDLGATSLVNSTVQAVASGLGNIITAKDGAVFGYTEVFLNGLRSAVRTEETNLGNLTADANLATARLVDPSTAISLKNGGGIRDAIGTVGTGAEPSYLPPAANPAAGKPAGGISRLDIENSLRFNNKLVLLTVTAAQLKEILEHAVASTAPGATPGQFPQVAGLRFAFDPSRQRQVLNSTTFEVTTPGERIRTVVVDLPEGGVDIVVQDGAVVGDPQRSFRMVTLNFLEGGGDGYPFPRYKAENPGRYALLDLAGGASAAFDAFGYEQEALASYLRRFHGTLARAYRQADTPASADQRIQNLAQRASRFAPLLKPQVSAAGIFTAEDSPVRVLVQLSDPDTPVEQLVFSASIADSALAALSVSGTGDSRQLLVTPRPQRHGGSLIALAVSDGQQTTTLEVPLTVVSVNDPPTAQNVALDVVAGSAVSGSIQAADVDGDALTVTLARAPQRGTVTITDAGSGAFRYSVPDGPAGSDSFVLQVSDGSLQTTATVTVTIAAGPGSASPPPAASDDEGRCGVGLAGILVGLLLLGLRRRR